MIYKHLTVCVESFAELEILAKTWRLDKKTTTENIIRYFTFTGEDPSSTRKDNTAVAIKKLENTVVSFFRKHEKDHLLKIVADFEATRKAFEETIKKLAESQTAQTKEIVGKIEKVDATNEHRLADYFYDGISFLDAPTFSVKDELEKLSGKDDKIVKLITEMVTKNEKKKQALFNRLEAMEEGVKKWGTITKDGNKEKGIALIEELKTLVNVQY